MAYFIGIGPVIVNIDDVSKISFDDKNQYIVVCHINQTFREQATSITITDKKEYTECVEFIKSRLTTYNDLQREKGK